MQIIFHRDKQTLEPCKGTDGTTSGIVYPCLVIHVQEE